MPPPVFFDIDAFQLGGCTPINILLIPYSLTRYNICSKSIRIQGVWLLTLSLSAKPLEPLQAHCEVKSSECPEVRPITATTTEAVSRRNMNAPPATAILVQGA